MKSFVRVLQEPLFHFLLIGAGLFALTYAFAAKPPEREPDTILVSQQRLKSLILIFQRTWQRPPTQEELDGLIDQYVREEVYYREALAMGLDRDDTMLRRRLRQKLEFVAEDIADAVEPTDAELQEYLDEHPMSFRVERLVTFQQVFLSPERRGDALESDIAEILSKLRDRQVSPLDVGDPSLLPPFEERRRETEVASLFGPLFAEQLLVAPIGEWGPPIESTYGVHLVLLQEMTSGRIPRLDEVREAVRREWIAERRVSSKEEFYRALRKKYDVVVEKLDLTENGDDDAESGT